MLAQRLHPTVYFTLLILWTTAASADPPLDYYDSVDPSTPARLRATLHEVIDDHDRFPYTSGGVDTWTILEEAGQDPGDPGSILDIYKNAVYPKAGGENGNYSREHAWPSSYGFPQNLSDNYPFTDCHALFLSNASYNSSRGNTLYRTCNASCTERPTDFNHGRGGGTGVYPGNSNWRQGVGNTGTWETWRGRRGDVARALFYMDVRYEGGFHGVTGDAEPDLILTDDPGRIATSGEENAAVAYMGLRSTLLQWHHEDPVDPIERAHNEAVASFQGNRNAFVDHPEWVSCLFQGICAATGPCAPGPTALCLGGGRFEVTATWDTGPDRQGNGQAVPLTTDTGYFWFFASTNVEVVVKVLDGCGVNKRFWVFAGGLTDVHTILSVRDTQTGQVKTYENPTGTAFQPIQDTEALPTCAALAQPVF